MQCIHTDSSTCHFHSQSYSPTSPQICTSLKPKRSSLSARAAEFFSASRKSKCERESQRETKRNSSTSTRSTSTTSSTRSQSHPEPPYKYFQLEQQPSTGYSSQRLSTFEPLRPSEPWTNPPNRKIPSVTLSPVSPVQMGALPWEGQSRQQERSSYEYKPKTAWERIGERRAMESGVAW